jgi:hypothetical protein
MQGSAAQENASGLHKETTRTLSHIPSRSSTCFYTRNTLDTIKRVSRLLSMLQYQREIVISMLLYFQ